MERRRDKYNIIYIWKRLEDIVSSITKKVTPYIWKMGWGF